MMDNFAYDRNKFAIIGGGSFQNYKSYVKGCSTGLFRKYVKAAYDNSSIITLRDNVPNILAGTDFKVMPCPALFAIDLFNPDFAGKSGELKLCNMMPLGSHYKSFDRGESSIWRKIAPELHRLLRREGFHFIPHSMKESEYALNNGWAERQVLKPDSFEDMLSLYGKASHYFGNRVHGAIVSRRAGASVLHCGFDSRMEAVKLTGALSVPPSLCLQFIKSWLTSEIPFPDIDVSRIYTDYRNILENFMRA